MSLIKLSLDGKNKIILAQEELISDIPAGDGKTANPFLQCREGGLVTDKGYLSTVSSGRGWER